MERIMQCVNEHYRDLDFNVSRAAEYLGMSVPYLSNLFKQQTGIGLLNYISGCLLYTSRERLRLKMELEQRSKALHDLYLDKSRGILEEEQFLELNRV